MKSAKMSRGNRRWGVGVATVFATSLLLGLGVTGASAGTAYSPDGFFTTGGHQYVNRAIINTTTSFEVAITDTGFSAGGTTAGYAGARGRLFTSGGSMYCEGANSYNSSGALAVGYSCNPHLGGAWYSYGVSLGWNGSGYNSFYTYKSTFQSS